MRAFLASFCLLMLAGGCAQLPAEHDAGVKLGGLPATYPVWPQPPHSPKIAYVTSVAGARDTGESLSLLRRVGKWLGVVEELRLTRPTGVAIGGNLLAIADPGSRALFLFDAEKGRWRRVTEGKQGPLVSPVGVAIAASGVIYLSDSALGRIYTYDHNGRLEAAWEDPELVRPSGIAFDDDRERLYVVDAARHTVVAYDTAGRRLFTIGRRGDDDGSFSWPSNVNVGPSGLIYVVDSLNFRVQVFSDDGQFRYRFGRPGDGSGDLSRPKGVAVDSEGHIYLVDALFDAVQIFDAGGEYLLTFGDRGTEAGEFWLPTGIAIDDNDRIYVADSYNGRVQVFQFVSEHREAPADD